MTEQHRDQPTRVKHRHHTGTDTPVVPVPFGPVAGLVQVIGTDCILMGFSVLETTGAAPAEVDIIDGSTATGRPLAFVALTAGKSDHDTFSSWGIAIETALSVNVSAGTAKGVLWVIMP